MDSSKRKLLSCQKVRPGPGIEPGTRIDLKWLIIVAFHVNKLRATEPCVLTRTIVAAWAEERHVSSARRGWNVCFPLLRVE